MPTSDAAAWPKPWGEIREPTKERGNAMIDPTNTWLELGRAMRVYDGTVYINFDGGRETDDLPDLWMPLEVYLRGGYE